MNHQNRKMLHHIQIERKKNESKERNINANELNEIELNCQKLSERENPFLRENACALFSSDQPHTEYVLLSIAEEETNENKRWHFTYCESIAPNKLNAMKLKSNSTRTSNGIFFPLLWRWQEAAQSRAAQN